MIGPADLAALACELITRPQVDEVGLRRGISSLYYALFHRLAASGASRFASGGLPLENRVGRAYNHTPMRHVCERYLRSPAQPFKDPLSSLNLPAPSSRLTDVVDAFLRLQEARHTADYDLSTAISYDEASELLDLSQKAHISFDAIEKQPATIVFLAALLFDDRWARKG